MKTEILEVYSREKNRAYEGEDCWETKSLMIEPSYQDGEFFDVFIYFKLEHSQEHHVSLEDLGYNGAEELLRKIDLEHEHHILDSVFSQELSEMATEAEDWEETKRDLIRYR